VLECLVVTTFDFSRHPVRVEVAAYKIQAIQTKHRYHAINWQGSRPVIYVCGLENGPIVYIYGNGDDMCLVEPSSLSSASAIGLNRSLLFDFIRIDIETSRKFLVFYIRVAVPVEPVNMFAFEVASWIRFLHSDYRITVLFSPGYYL
jgi:hypothetical protein